MDVLYTILLLASITQKVEKKLWDCRGQPAYMYLLLFHSFSVFRVLRHFEESYQIRRFPCGLRDKESQRNIGYWIIKCWHRPAVQWVYLPPQYCSLRVPFVRTLCNFSLSFPKGPHNLISVGCYHAIHLTNYQTAQILDKGPQHWWGNHARAFYLIYSATVLDTILNISWEYFFGWIVQQALGRE